MRIENLTIAAGCCLLLLAGSGCKPTEKGYRQAYDAAKAKREYVDPDAELLTGGHKLLDEKATNWKIIGSDTLQVQHMALTPEEGSHWPQSGPYRLAVAKFKMNTNSRSLLRDITGKAGITPVMASDGKGGHYIIAGSATYPDSLAHVLATFRKENPGFRNIGLTPEAPLIVVAP